MSAQTPPADGFGLYLATISVGMDDEDDDFAERYREHCGDCGLPDSECECEYDDEGYEGHALAWAHFDPEGEDDACDAPVDAGCAPRGAGLGAPAGGAAGAGAVLTPVPVPFGFSWAHFPF